MRKLIKTEALKQFNNDYDVLLYKVKDKEIRPGITLGKYVESLSQSISFDGLLQKLPLSTLFVPNLAAFSAEKWDTEGQVPFIAVLNEKNINNKVKVFRDTVSAELDLTEEPPVDVIVLKDNERVGVEAKANAYSKGDYIFSEGNYHFYFLDNSFKNTENTDQRAINLFPASTSELDPLVKEAYEAVKTNDYTTQRDYVYYNIFPPDGRKEGPLNEKYAEAITSVRIENEAALNNMGGWAEGNFEIHMIAFFLSGSGTDNLANLDKTLSVSADDLATYEIIKEEKCFLGICHTTREYKKFTGVKEYVPAVRTLQYVPWDMRIYGNRWLFKCYEFDDPTTITQTVTHKTTRGTNFKVTANADVKIVKVGVDLGVEKTEEITASTTIQVSKTNNSLGEAVLTWSDPVIKKIDYKYMQLLGYIPKTAYSNQLTTGSLIISFETVKQTQ